jgi:hypothetical protein
LQRKHQKGAGEQRHQRQHVQVHAVGARQVRHARGFRIGRDERYAGGQFQLRRQRLGRGTGPQLQLDARQPAQPVEPPLCKAEVHYGQ